MSNEAEAATIQRRGLMLVLSSPSGAGKTTLSRQLLGNDSQIQLSVSFTTREKRPGEKEGVDYRFVDTATFRGMIERGIYLPPSQYEAAFLSAAHTTGDIEQSIEAARNTFASFQSAIFTPNP